jgi:SAM-dependent methyltransferase
MSQPPPSQKSQGSARTPSQPPRPASQPPRPGRSPARARPVLGPSEAALFETFVVPRYMALFGSLMMEMVAEGPDAQVVHLQCRTGYPDRGMLAKLPGAHFYGVDVSAPAVELARAKAQTMSGMVASYRVGELPVPLTAGAFSHGYSLHPFVVPDERKRLFAELARLVAPRGQMLVATPMRGSFVEVVDLLREYALKHESGEVSKAAEAAVLLRPTVEELKKEVEAAGFDFVEVEIRREALAFKNGRDFFEDPLTRLLLLPELAMSLPPDATTAPLDYVRDAIDRYWSDGDFTLTVVVGCVSGRRL